MDARAPSASTGDAHKPLPPRGEGVGDGGAGACVADPVATGLRDGADTPTPGPSPQGGGEARVRKPRISGAVHTAQRAEASARRLRKAPTLGEDRLWKELRRLDLAGSHFRRQAPFGPYVLDFVCHAARLVVEVDGGVHRHPAVAQRDAERQAWLVQRGYAVLRIANQDALFDAQGVAQQILAATDTGAANPTLARQGQGEN